MSNFIVSTVPADGIALLCGKADIADWLLKIWYDAYNTQHSFDSFDWFNSFRTYM